MPSEKPPHAANVLLNYINSIVTHSAEVKTPMTQSFRRRQLNVSWPQIQ
jgi:hypothetical protein